MIKRLIEIWGYQLSAPPSFQALGRPISRRSLVFQKPANYDSLTNAAKARADHDANSDRKLDPAKTAAKNSRSQRCPTIRIQDLLISELDIAASPPPLTG